MNKKNVDIPACCLILLKESNVLLLRRYNTGYEDGNYSVIAGHVEAGETFTECIIRESKEEAGIILKPEDVKVVQVIHRKAQKGELCDRVGVFFIAKNWNGKIINKEPDKCDDLSWFDLNAMPKNVVPCVKRVIDCVKKKSFIVNYGFRL